VRLSLPLGFRAAGAAGSLGGSATRPARLQRLL